VAPPARVELALRQVAARRQAEVLRLPEVPPELAGLRRVARVQGVARLAQPDGPWRGACPSRLRAPWASLLPHAWLWAGMRKP